MYPWAWGKNTTQTKLLYVVDYQQGIFNFIVLESKLLKPHFPAYYKATQMRVNIGDIYPMDMIELHQKTSDMLYRGVLESSFDKRKMKKMVIEIENQLKKERVATKSNRIQINELEKKIISLGAYPINMKVVGDLIKEKHNEINIFKKYLNDLKVKHVHTLELQAIDKENEYLY